MVFRMVFQLPAALPPSAHFPRAILGVLLAAILPLATLAAEPAERIVWRTPVSVAASGDGQWLSTANRASGTVTLLSTTGTLADELAIGRRPGAIAARGEDGFVAVTTESGDLVVLAVKDGRLVETGRAHLGFEPHDVALSPDGATAWVPLAASGDVVAVDLASLAVSEPIPTGPLPRYVAVSPDGTTVAVACAAAAEIVVVDASARSVRSRHPFKGLNIGQPAFTPDGGTLYFTFTYDGGGFTSPGDIRRGWVTGSRLGKLELQPDGGTLHGLTLDVSGRAVGDVLGLSIVDDGRTVLVAAGGTHELLRFDVAAGLPWTQISGAEVMDRALSIDAKRFRRLELDGRPLGLTVAADRSRVFVANALLDAVQVVDPAGPELEGALTLSRGEVPTADEIVIRRGEAIFHDAQRSLDQWYSCHTCHWEGGGNTVTFDTLNDGSVGTYKTVLPLWHLADTGPWTWHGWQTDVRTAVRKSMIDTMQAPAPSDDDVTALTAFLTRLEAPPSPFRAADGSLSEAAERGRTLFESARAGCSDCHTPPFYTSPALQDVGLGKKEDRYPSYSPPTLLGGYRKTRWLHNARARSLEALLAGPHSPEKLTGQPPLTEAEIDDLVAWLKTL
jgi:DNA-binding beta-propeller fold protein YncE/mono/diheme cytochrome c family protein